MKRLLQGLATVATLSAFAALCVSPARAQSFLDPNQWIIKGGVSLPSKGLPKTISHTWAAGGLEYQVGDPNARRVPSLEVLYTTASDDLRFTQQDPISTRMRMLSLMANYRFRLIGPNNVAGGNVLFYGAGVGAQLIWTKLKDPNPGGYGNLDEQRTFGGANVFIGYEIAANFEIEAKYQFVFGKVLGDRMDALQLLAGLKF